MAGKKSGKKSKTGGGSKEPGLTLSYEAMRELNLDGLKKDSAAGTKLKTSSTSPLSIWVDGAAKGNHIAGVGRVAGVGVVSGHPCMPHMYGPVEFNGTELATNNAAELQAAILGLEQALYRGIRSVKLHTDSKLLENIMNKWMEQWKANNWRKCDGAPPKISIDLLKRLDHLNSEIDVSWTWVPRNSCPEMELADSLANHGCRRAIDGGTLPGEPGLNRLFRRTAYDRRLVYPDELPPTLLRTINEVQIQPGENVNIRCSLDISERLKQKLIESQSSIRNITSDQAYGIVTVMRTADPINRDGTVLAECHSFGSAVIMDIKGEAEMIQPTLVLPKGSAVGLAFSGCYATDDGQMDTSYAGHTFFTPIIK